MENADAGGGGGGGGAVCAWFAFDIIGVAGKKATSCTGWLPGPLITLWSLVYNWAAVPWFVYPIKSII